MRHLFTLPIVPFYQLTLCRYNRWGLWSERGPLRELILRVGPLELIIERKE